MSELGEYRRLVERPMIDRYESTIASLRAEIERSQDALQQLVDYIKDGCPDDGRYVPYPVYKAVERILDENSAWIARPSDEVTKRIALAATVAAHSIIAASAAEDK